MKARPVSMFMDARLCNMQQHFEENMLAYGIEPAIQKLAVTLDMDMHNMNGNIMTSIQNLYGVSEADAAFVSRQIANICIEKLNDGNTISGDEARDILFLVRNTDLPAEMKADLCEMVLQDALENHNIYKLETACIMSDGMSLEDFRYYRDGVADKFGEEEAGKIETIIMARESPDYFVNELREQLSNHEISTAEYIEKFAMLGEYMPDEYIQAMNMDFQVTVSDGEVSFHIQSGGRLDGWYEDIAVNDSNGELTIAKEDAIKLIQKVDYHSDSALDCICEVNVPPSDPTFVSELAQKFANYAYTECETVADREDARQVLSSILPDDQISTFNSLVNDCIKQQMEMYYNSEISDSSNPTPVPNVDFVDENHNGIDDLDEDQSSIDKRDENGNGIPDIDEDMDIEEEEDEMEWV